MRVLHITNAGGFGRVQSGGAERAVGELSSALADNHGWEEYVFAPAEFLQRQEFSDSVTKIPASLDSFGLPSALSPRSELQTAIRKVNPDVILGHLLRGTISGAAAARFASKGTFVSVLHNSLHDMDAGRANLAGFHFVSRHVVDLHVAISTSNRRDLIEKDGIEAARTVLIHNWVSSEFAPSDQLSARTRMRSALGLGEDEFVMAIVGRLEAQKNHEFVIKALPEIPTGQLLIAGEGSLEEHLRQIAKAAGVVDRAHFLGHRSPVAPVMEAADVVLVPSLFEGFGRTVVEALAVGTPIVVSDLEPIREILELLPQTPATVVPVNDHAAWVQAVNDRASAARPTRNERTLLATTVQNKFGLAASASAYDSAFRGLLKQRL